MAEGKVSRFEQCFFQYHSDRYAWAKLAQIYQLLGSVEAQRTKELRNNAL